jgi:hypothetical protein
VHEYRDRDDPHIGFMLDLYRKDDLPKEKKIQLAFALAKAFEDLADYPRAFEYLATGNRLRYETFNYTIDSDAELIQNIIDTFSADALARLRIDGEASNRPIFILGMPRSGTSLVEKILASHSAVYGAGELEYIYALGARLFLKEYLHYQFAPLESYPQSAFRQLGQAYLQKINLLNDQAGRITDKLPFNMSDRTDQARPAQRENHPLRQGCAGYLPVHLPAEFRDRQITGLPTTCEASASFTTCIKIDETLAQCVFRTLYMILNTNRSPGTRSRRYDDCWRPAASTGNRVAWISTAVRAS